MAADSTLSEYDYFWETPNAPDNSFTDFNTSWNTSLPNSNRSDNLRNRPDLLSSLPSNPYNNNHRRQEHLSAYPPASSDSNNANPSSLDSELERAYEELFQDPIPDLPNQQLPTNTFPQESRPSHSNQPFQLPSIDHLFDDIEPPVEFGFPQSPQPHDSPTPRTTENITRSVSRERDTPFNSSPWTAADSTGFTDHRDYVDLTTNSSPAHNIMPPVTRKRRASGNATPAASAPSPARMNKRRKFSDATVKEEEKPKVEQIDLLDVNDDNGLSSVREQQHAAAIKEQQVRHGDLPTKLSSLQCIICMEPMTNITVTHCGHLFCHTCIMEALIAGENQGEPGKATSKCPVCRKKVSRPKEKGKDKREVIPLEIKCVTRKSLAKAKAKV
ncbi:MAG: hypothetical protein Q9170_004331 [Blastenia crenularia]